jgi:hypothetical protein
MRTGTTSDKHLILSRRNLVTLLAKLDTATELRDILTEFIDGCAE